MSASCIGIVADDLTGGAAIAGEIARPGQPVPVIRLEKTCPLPAQTLVVETSSRYMPGAQAAARVEQAVSRLQQAGFTLLMKKIDSTLKGNVATELAAFARATAGRVVIVAACPTMQISVREGWQWKAAEKGVDVAGLVGDALGWRPDVLPLATVREGKTAVSAWFRQHASPVIVADAESQRDIQQLVDGARQAGIDGFAGVYGLGQALAGLSEPAMPPPPDGAHRLLVMSGSTSRANMAQIDWLVAQGAEAITIDVAALCGEQHRSEMARLSAAIAASRSPVVLLHTDAKNSAAVVREVCRARGWNDRDLAQALAAPFAEAVRQLPQAGLFLVGGETTGALFDLQGWQTLRVNGEFSATVSIARVPATQHPAIFTKPGAFGAETVLHDVARWLLPHL
ncbi:hypothetical protein PMPD1_2702 [Paramixta manurensis]|uniref:Four-carbon acid sugar kinase family protein n=1 Tax=Paramixta manurensis TaxID=2740817 RepID=A0A6M8UFG6_9GAMM|nr:hypothetical protein PMPD1_2702 [Erwiniaceae bacterium PD-1]